MYVCMWEVRAEKVRCMWDVRGMKEWECERWDTYIHAWIKVVVKAHEKSWLFREIVWRSIYTHRNIACQPKGEMEGQMVYMMILDKYSCCSRRRRGEGNIAREDKQGQEKMMTHCYIPGMRHIAAQSSSPVLDLFRLSYRFLINVIHTHTHNTSWNRCSMPRILRNA